MLDALEAGRHGEHAPRLQGQVGAVAQPLLALDVGAPGVAAKQHAARHQGAAKVPEHPAELLRGHVEEHRVGEDAVEALGGQVEGEEVLMPDLAPGRGPSHGHERGRAVEADRVVPARAEGREVAPRPAAQVEDALGRRPGQVAEQGVHVLRDVVVLGPLAEVLGALLVVGHGRARGVGQLLRREASERAGRLQLRHLRGA
ncbi:hypothetical protein PPSIR1_21604 [Plesiocystis pacifica SIR-1]|uniref:Uncharacterized protein n=1 Tax=Plesiocystis pacifica SIR-1 TaxID=391625 RepID=A6FXG8_9BACT|nr:hypothetical protein PPSIR1_21604 [Plesiocystis pacifica SIR-1]